MSEINHRWKVLLVCTAFLLSGGCGLVYEVLWTRYLADLMGATSLSQLVVLMVFMGGLSLGAILIGRRVDRGGNGLACYGWLEIGIGLYAVIFPFLFSKVAGIFVLVGANFEPGSMALLVLKLLVASLLIALPSVAMGGTLPAVTRYITRSQSGLRRNISVLYGLNSLGAVAGVLLAGFFLVYRYGLSRSMIYVGTFNLGLGIAALVAARLFGPDREFGAELENGGCLRRNGQQDCLIYRRGEVKLAIVIAGLSGFAAMALQIAWIRYFVIVLGASHSAFTVVVAAFICGIGLGGLLVSTGRVERTPLTLMLALLFALASATLWLGTFFYGRIPFEIKQVLEIFPKTPFAWPFYLSLKFGICFALMLLPAVASGMILPICVRIASRGKERIGRDVALVYGVNTLGALLGIVLTGQWLFRIFTLPRTLQFILFIYLTITIILALAQEGPGRKSLLGFSSFLLLAHLIFWHPWPPKQLYVDRIDFIKNPAFAYADFLTANSNEKLVEERQGPDVQVSVHDISYPDKITRSMVINGKPDASTGIDNPDMPTQILLGHLPMLLHPDPRRAFVLGVGSGVTTGEILKFPGVEKVVTAELATEVFEASKNFAADNGRYWENPKHRMVIDDAKSFLRFSKEKFEVIALEPTNVWQKGMAGLFSEEFFRLAKARLTADGVIAQWLHIYQLDDLTLNIILKTFSRVFPEASVFQVSDMDFLLVGYGEQWQFDPLKMERRFYLPRILQSQVNVRNTNPSTLLLREVMSRKDFQEYTTVVKAPVNTENFPVLEETAEYSRFISAIATIFAAQDSRLNPDGNDLLIHAYFQQAGIDQAQLQAMIGSETVGSDRLRESLKLLAVERLRLEKQRLPDEQLRESITDQQLLGVITQPDYRRPAAEMTAEAAYQMLSGELYVWHRAASQLWTPNQDRLHQLYNRFASGVDRGRAGVVARETAMSLAANLACGAALPFFRIAEEQGALEPAMLQLNEMVTNFYCEMKRGEAGKALAWWKLIEEQKVPGIEAITAHKATLDIKLGGQPPPAVYGRQPD